VRDTQEAALEALLRYLLNPPEPKPIPELVEDLQALLGSGASAEAPGGDRAKEYVEPLL
jgi:hypothetical protein